MTLGTIINFGKFTELWNSAGSGRAGTCPSAGGQGLEQQQYEKEDEWQQQQRQQQLQLQYWQ